MYTLPTCLDQRPLFYCWEYLGCLSRHHSSSNTDTDKRYAYGWMLCSKSCERLNSWTWSCHIIQATWGMKKTHILLILRNTLPNALSESVVSEWSYPGFRNFSFRYQGLRTIQAYLCGVTYPNRFIKSIPPSQIYLWNSSSQPQPASIIQSISSSPPHPVHLT